MGSAAKFYYPSKATKRLFELSTFFLNRFLWAQNWVVLSRTPHINLYDLRTLRYLLTNHTLVKLRCYILKWAIPLLSRASRVCYKFQHNSAKGISLAWGVLAQPQIFNIPITWQNNSQLCTLRLDIIGLILMKTSEANNTFQKEICIRLFF